jgi:hypothetical protein
MGGTGSGADAAGQDGPVVIARPSTEIEAELIVGLLAGVGVQADVLTDEAGGVEPQWQAGGVRVITAAADADRARELLRERERR